jgi:hypothetical protein
MPLFILRQEAPARHAHLMFQTAQSTQIRNNPGLLSFYNISYIKQGIIRKKTYIGYITRAA